jgi:aldehyde:ferredoxin oxidoreductase
MHRRIDRDKFEDWKSRFYAQEGCGTDSGWPTRATLEGFGLKQVANELEKNKRLGREDKA